MVLYGSTTLEQSTIMYSSNDTSIRYWKDWAERFINCCLNIGWEVAVGPGTSLGPIVLGSRAGTDPAYHTVFPPQSSCWDCDWTQVDGIVEQWQDSKYYGFPLYTGWFKNFPVWPSNANEHGIDETTGRFDFIIYTGTGVSGEKIGFRIKYPVCSVGYSINYEPVNWGGAQNFIYNIPFFSIYSSRKGDIESPPEGSLNVFEDYSRIYNNYDYPSKGYLRLFGKEKFGGMYNYSNYPLSNYLWGKTDDKNTQFKNLNYPSTEIVTSPLWSLELQQDLDFTICPLSYYTPVTVRTRLFKEYWKRYNRFYWHISKSSDTTYMYVTDLDKNIGIKLITFTLESGEKGIMLERRDIEDDNTLCECAAVTGYNQANPSQAFDSFLIKLPTRPYRKVVSQNGRFSFSRMLLPTQVSLCTDLYYVTKRDSTDLIEDGQYVLVVDKNSKNRYFRVVPFGSNISYEATGDNTTYLAFPVEDPPQEEL